MHVYAHVCMCVRGSEQCLLFIGLAYEQCPLHSHLASACVRLFPLGPVCMCVVRCDSMVPPL